MHAEEVKLGQEAAKCLTAGMTNLTHR